MRSATESRQWTKAHQSLHRAELKLAKLRKRKRQIATREKFLLGNLVYLLNWQTDSLADLEEQIEKCMLLLGDETKRSHYERLGGIHFQNRETSNRSTKSVLSEPQRRQLAHHKITIGGLWVKHGAHEFKRAQLLGAMIDLTECN